MRDLERINRELDAARERNDHRAQIGLITAALALSETLPYRAGYLDELAYAYEKLGRFEEAIDAMREAVAAGWEGELDDHPSAQALIADLLLRAGRDQGETMDALGLAPDELQLRAEELIERQEQQDREYEREFLRTWNQPRTIAPQQAYIGIAWFPPDQYQRALETWPSFAEDYEHGPYAAYCARLELLLRDLNSQGVKRLALTPLTIDDYLAWCAEHDRDPEEPDSRASYATELIGRDVAQPWPPQRNEPCWCASGRKYKKCCLLHADS